MWTESKPYFSQNWARWMIWLKGSLAARNNRHPNRIPFGFFTCVPEELLVGHFGYELFQFHVVEAPVYCD